MAFRQATEKVDSVYLNRNSLFSGVDIRFIWLTYQFERPDLTAVEFSACILQEILCLVHTDVKYVSDEESMIVLPVSKSDQVLDVPRALSVRERE